MADELKGCIIDEYNILKTKAYSIAYAKDNSIKSKRSAKDVNKFV